MSETAHHRDLCSFVVRQDDRVIVIEVIGDLDIASCATLAFILDGSVGGPPVYLDLSGLTFLDLRGYDTIRTSFRRIDPVVRVGVRGRWFDRIDDLVRRNALPQPERSSPTGRPHLRVVEERVGGSCAMRA